MLRMFWRALLDWLLGMDLELGGLSFHAAGRLPADLELVPGGVRLLAP